MSDNPISDFQNLSAAFYKISQNLVQLGNGEVAEMAEPGGESEVTSSSPFVQSSYAFINHAGMMQKDADDFNSSSTDISSLADYVKTYIQGAAKKLYTPSQNSARQAGAEDLLNGADKMYAATQSNNTADFLEGAEQLVSGTNKYAGGANEYIAAEEYINGAFTLKTDTNNWAAQNSEANLNTLFTDSEYMNVGAQWQDQGAELYYIGAEEMSTGAEAYANGAENVPKYNAQNIQGAAQAAEDSAEIYQQHAFGSAEHLGSTIMTNATHSMFTSAQTIDHAKVADMDTFSAETFEGAESLKSATQQMVGGAEIYLAGAEEMYGAEAYNDGADKMTNAVSGGKNNVDKNELIKASKFIIKGSQNYAAGSAEYNWGAAVTGNSPINAADDLIPASQEILKAAAIAASGANPSTGSAKLLLMGAEGLLNSAENDVPSMEHNARILLKGAEEYAPMLYTADKPS